MEVAAALPAVTSAPKSGDTQKQLDTPSSWPSRSKSEPANNFSDTYSLDWLFDPDRCYDHLPLEEQLRHYEQRDLTKGKLFRFASSVFGPPKTRKRVIIAPPMCTKWEEKSTPIPMNSRLQPQKSVKEVSDDVLMKDRDSVASYQHWLQERKAFRSNLENMGLSEEWLSRKPSKTPMEQRVLRRMLEEKYPRIPTPPLSEDSHLEAVLPAELPVIKRSSPLALRIIENLLKEKQMRLIDLFASADKDKNWKVSREEFRQTIKQADLPISEVLLEDLIQTLDQDLNNQLDYRELAKGMELWRLEKREAKRKLLGSEAMSKCPKTYSTLSGFEPPEKNPNSEEGRHPVTRSSPAIGKDPTQELAGSAGTASPERVKSAVSTLSSDSLQYLEPPEPDLRPEQMVAATEEEMVERRKRDKVAMRLGSAGSARVASPEEAPGTVKTGDHHVDSNCQLSTLTGETGELVNKFRQLKCKEYNDICKLCKLQSMPFTEELLRKVLLFPPDKPHSTIGQHVRQPAKLLLSSDVASRQQGLLSTRFENQKSESGRPKVKTDKGHAAEGSGTAGWKDDRDSTKTKREGPEGKQSRESGRGWLKGPMGRVTGNGDEAHRHKKQRNLSFEEYDTLTRKLARRYTELHGKTSGNAFWPGHLLDKLRLCMPNSEPKSSSVFSTVNKSHQRSYPGYNNDLNTWPRHPKGFIQYGLTDPYANKYI